MNQSSVRMPRRQLTTWVRKLEAALRRRGVRLPRGAALNVVFMNEEEARELNQRYRGKAYATDVLSFEGAEPLGDLVLCPQVLQKQAREHGLSFFAETGYMVLHGCLHLLGYDHEKSERQARRMFALQDAVFDELLRSARRSSQRQVSRSR